MKNSHRISSNEVNQTMKEVQKKIELQVIENKFNIIHTKYLV